MVPPAKFAIHRVIQGDFQRCFVTTTNKGVKEGFKNASSFWGYFVIFSHKGFRALNWKDFKVHILIEKKNFNQSYRYLFGKIFRSCFSERRHYPLIIKFFFFFFKGSKGIEEVEESYKLQLSKLEEKLLKLETEKAEMELNFLNQKAELEQSFRIERAELEQNASSTNREMDRSKKYIDFLKDDLSKKHIEFIEEMQRVNRKEKQVGLYISIIA